MSLDLGQAVKDAVKEAVREVMKELHASGALGPTEALLTKKQAAAFAGVCVTTIDAWEKSGALDVHRNNRVVRYERAALCRAMAGGSVRAVNQSIDEQAAALLAKSNQRK